MTAAAVANRIFRFRPPTVRYHSSLTLPASFLRGGTSKGVFINRDFLPTDKSEWPRIFLSIMGSPDSEYGRQLDGMGGGISSLSKVCVVGKPTEEQQSQGIHAEYTFAQIGVRDDSVDLSGNCGNLSSVIGAFAVDEKICQPPIHAGRVTVRSFNTNTRKLIDTTFPASQTAEGVVADLSRPETAIAGVSGKASKIIMEFVNPGGARTGKLLPTGAPMNSITLPQRDQKTCIDASLIDAANPTVFVSYPQLNDIFLVDSYMRQEEPALTQVGEVLEKLRQQGAKMMGLDPTAPSQPKIALLSPPARHDLGKGVDIVIHTLSMGVLHKAVPMTVGLCLGVAANAKGTLAWNIVRQSRERRSQESDPGLIRIKHPTGIVDVGAEFNNDGMVKSAKVIRTGRKLMKGVVWW
ncbi:hypothetical protein AX15_006625 [Amanita polypyramis BW_CC]|nr:hypothetical protein AX15_006625 [Amanita polypyramis BW_CC]